MEQAIGIALAVFSLSVSAGVGIGLGLALAAELIRMVGGKGRAVFLTYSKIEKADRE